MTTKRKNPRKRARVRVSRVESGCAVGQGGACMPRRGVCLHAWPWSRGQRGKGGAHAGGSTHTRPHARAHTLTHSYRHVGKHTCTLPKYQMRMLFCAHLLGHSRVSSCRFAHSWSRRTGLGMKGMPGLAPGSVLAGLGADMVSWRVCGSRGPAHANSSGVSRSGTEVMAGVWGAEMCRR